MNLSDLQKTIADFVAEYNLEIPVQMRLLDLLSEIGEVSKEVLKGTQYGRKGFVPTEEWASELGDVLFALICVANSTNVDLRESLQNVLEKYRQRLAVTGDAGSDNRSSS